MNENILKKIKHVQRNILYYERIYPGNVKKIEELKKQLEEYKKQLENK